MGGRKIQFVENHFYHVYNRGVDKRNIFLDDFDYIRFLESLRDFNDVEIVGSLYLKSIREKRFRSKAPKKASEKQKRPLVRILCYCLMTNHFHLLLEQLEERGITEFMHRLGTGYTNFFNLKYERTGRLFEGPFQAVLIEQDNQLNHILRYIHLNPLDILEPGWRENGIKDLERVEKFLENYRWSSHLAYLSERESQIINKGIFDELFKGKTDYQNFLRDWVVKDLSYLKNLILE